MAKIPDAALGGPGDQPWKRHVDDGIDAAKRAIERMQSGNSATDKGLAASVAGLSRQVADLVGRQSYQAFDASSASWSATTAGDYPFGPTVDITLDEPRVVSIAFMVTADSSAYTTNAGTAVASAATRVAIDGVTITDGSPGYILSSTASNTGGSGFNRIVTTAIARCIVTLGAGSHSIRGLVRSRQVSFSGTGSGGGGIGVDSPALFVDVLQPA